MENVRRNNFGFTFVEIFSVLVISGMIFSLSLAFAGDLLKQEKSDRVVFNMYSDISRLRNNGIFTLTQSRVKFYKNYNNTGQSAYVMQTLINNIWRTKEKVILGENFKIFSLTFPGGSTNQNFSFYGTPLYSGSVGLSSDEGEIYYLVFYHSGRIRIKEGA